jgi:hypothetical protein
MKKEFNENDIPALDFILKKLVSRETPVTMDDLASSNLIKKGIKIPDAFTYYAEILQSYECCEINTKMPMYHVFGEGKSMMYVYNNGGFKKIYDSMQKEKKDNRIIHEGTLSNAKTSKIQYYLFWPTTILGILGGIYALCQLVLLFV